MDRTRMFLLLAATCAIGACADQVGGVGATESSGVTVETPRLPIVGDLPAPAGDGPDVELLACELVDDVVEIKAVVTNHSSRPVLLQGVDVTLRDGGRVIEGPDETSGLWNSITIGPGRRAFMHGEEDVSGPVDDLACELGPPDLRDNAHRSSGKRLDPALVELASCDERAPLRVENPTNTPIGVYVVVEFFDDRGYSAGQIDMGQYPTTYTDGRRPGPLEVALPAGETGVYPVQINDRVDRYETPLTGPIASCEVLTARYVLDPQPSEVIVD